MKKFSGEIKLRIVRTPPKKTVSMRVVASGGGVVVVVRAAVRVSEEFIEQFVRERESWITTQAAKIMRAQDHMNVGDSGSVDILTQREIVKRFTERYEAMLALFGLPPHSAPRLSVRLMRSRWGSYRSGTYSIALNSALSRTSDELVDYVIVHELCHRTHLHHGAAFYAELACRMPDWSERRRLLRQLEPALLGHHVGE